MIGQVAFDTTGFHEPYGDGKIGFCYQDSRTSPLNVAKERHLEKYEL